MTVRPLLLHESLSVVVVECWLKENPCITILHGSGAGFSYPLCLPRENTSVAAMATVEAMTQLLTQNAEFFRTMQQQQHQQVQEMLNLLQTMMAESGGGSDRRGEGLKERRFRELGNFSGSEEEWKEFGLKFGAVVKETEPELFKAMKWAETEENDITEDSIQGNWDEEQAVRMTTMLYNRLIHHLKGAALTIHQGVVGENGLEVWRRLARRYDPMTPMRGDADHAQGDAPSEDRQEPRCAHTGQQVGEPHQHLGAGLPGEGLGHDEGRLAHPYDAP